MLVIINTSLPYKTTLYKTNKEESVQDTEWIRGKSLTKIKRRYQNASLSSPLQKQPAAVQHIQLKSKKLSPVLSIIMEGIKSNAVLYERRGERLLTRIFGSNSFMEAT